MPRDTPRANMIECRETRRERHLIDGLITDCGAEIARRKEAEGWFDMSTLKEPYRVEGKKTLGYELAEQFDWALPDVILYPTGGGTGLIGMWKAFDEMETMGWIGAKRPRMFSVQASGCAPIVRAFEAGADQRGGISRCAYPRLRSARAESGRRFSHAQDPARIQRRRASRWMTRDDSRDARSRRRARDSLLRRKARRVSRLCRQLGGDGKIESEERVVIFNTGSGIKYLECYEE